MEEKICFALSYALANKEPILGKKKSVNTKVKTLFGYMVPWAGVEPARSFERGILSPLRLPISPPRQINLISRSLYIKMKKTLQFFMFSIGILVTYLNCST